MIFTAKIGKIARQKPQINTNTTPRTGKIKNMLGARAKNTLYSFYQRKNRTAVYFRVNEVFPVGNSAPPVV